MAATLDGLNNRFNRWVAYAGIVLVTTLFSFLSGSKAGNQAYLQLTDPNKTSKLRVTFKAEAKRSTTDLQRVVEDASKSGDLFEVTQTKDVVIAAHKVDKETARVYVLSRNDLLVVELQLPKH